MVEKKISDSIPVAGEEVRPLSETDLFGLSCGPEACASNCCKNGPAIVLNPYEIAQICSTSGMSYEDLLDIVDTGRADGFPLVMLPRDPACHFWTEKGCGIYDARPLACRLFPLGRVFHEGRSHIVLPERNMCAGLVNPSERTISDYLRENDTRTYLEMADRWIEFSTDMESLGLPDRPVTSVAFHMMVYSPGVQTAGAGVINLSHEDAFLKRLAHAREQMPRFQFAGGLGKKRQHKI